MLPFVPLPAVRRVNHILGTIASPGLWRWSWLVIFLVALFARSPYPPDETRYLSVAWEMWRDGQFLLPHLNGLPYPDKPPLLFWLWHAGWAIFGVGDAWPRFLAAAFMGASAFGLHEVAKCVWPEDGKASQFTPLVFVGTLFVALYTQMLMFDSLVVLILVAGWRALLAHRGAGWKAGLLAGAGVLAKGPVVFVYLVPLLLFMPQFRERRTRLLLTMLATGLVLPAAWFLALWLQGHTDFIETLLFGQVVARVEGEIGHGRPPWWYLPLLPLMLLPWSFMPALWRDARNAVRRDASVSGIVTAGAVALAALSIIGGKQAHYLLPLLAMISVPLGRALATGVSGLRYSMFQAFAAVAVVFLLVPAVLADFDFVHLNGVQTLDWWPAILPATLFVASLFVDIDTRPKTIELISLSSVVMALAILLLAFPVTNRTHDLRSAAAMLSAAERAGFDLAYVGNYQGEFNFLGRLQRPLAEIEEDDVAAWQDAHPRSLVVVRSKRADGVDGDLIYTQPYRSGELLIRVRGAEAPRHLD